MCSARRPRALTALVWRAAVTPLNVPAHLSSADRRALSGFVEGARLILANQQTWEHDTLGTASHTFSMQHDLVLARQDWVVKNDALALLNVAVAPDVGFTVGAYSDLRWVPHSSYVGHQVGPMVAVSFERVTPEVRTIDLFVRGGYYTHHVTRSDELTILGGVSIDYDLGGVR